MWGCEIEERTANFGDGKEKVAIFIPHQFPPKASRRFKEWAELIDEDFFGDYWQEADCMEYVCEDYNSVKIIESKAEAEDIAENYKGHQWIAVRSLAKQIAEEW